VRAAFSGVLWSTEGTGCCAKIGTINADTRITCYYKSESVPASSGAFCQFQPAQEYAERIAQELGGVCHHSTTLIQAALHRFKSTDASSYVQPSTGAIISGLPGVGKTCLAKAIANSLGVSLEFLNAANVFQTFVGHSEVELVNAFERAIRKSPCILVIDGVEAIAASRDASADSQSALEVGVLGTLLASLDRIKKASLKVFVIGTTTRPEDLDAAVVSNGRMDVAVKIEPPTQPQRKEMLQIMTRGWPTTALADTFLDHLSESTGGFVGADLLSLCQKTLQNALNDAAKIPAADPDLLPRHFDQALASTYPSALQSHNVSQRESPHDTASISGGEEPSPFSRVFGLDQAIESIKVSLIEPLEDCSRFLAYGTVPPKGILLTGPSGAGKSHLALAIADEVRRRGLASFVSVRCTDLLNKVVGDTEKALRELFATARNAAPCVLFFDQIESIAPVRGFDTSTEQTFDRMLSMLLVEMDGFTTSRAKLQDSLTSTAARAAFLKEHVVVLASTTHKELLDPAILRPGYRV
jgi:transitional endoplasmic reticulum ATPase